MCTYPVRCSVDVRQLELHAVCWRSLPAYCARLCTWAESTWWVVLIGVANKTQYLRSSWTLPDNSKRMKPVFQWYRRICCTYESIRHLDLQIWQFSCLRQTTDKTNYFTPCACARGKYVLQYSQFPHEFYLVYNKQADTLSRNEQLSGKHHQVLMQP